VRGERYDLVLRGCLEKKGVRGERYDLVLRGCLEKKG